MTEPVAGFHGNSRCSIRVKGRRAAGLEVHVGGELDEHTACTFGLVLEECLPERRPILLDLGDVTFIDRPALETIAHVCRRALAPITIVAASGCVDRLLEIVDHREALPSRLVG